jgi:TPR repeat protein
VVAEDGQIYERSAILKHFESFHGQNISSPMTRKTIGDNLIPSAQTKTFIEVLIQSGRITGELADDWTRKERERNAFKDLLSDAEGGDSDAMLLVGESYHFGQYGVSRDGNTAFEWFKRASDAGDTKGMTFVGMSRLGAMEGINVEKNAMSGIMLLTMAAERRSDLACIYLGRMLATGTYGFPKDPSTAIHFLKKGLSEHSDVPSGDKEVALVYLRRLEEEVSASGVSP